MDGQPVTVAFGFVCLYLCGLQTVAVATTDFENVKNDVLVDVKEYINKVLLERDRNYERKLEELTDALVYQRKRFENKINIMQATIDRNKKACSTEISDLKFALNKYLVVNSMDNSEDSPNTRTEEQMQTPSATNTSETNRQGYHSIPEHTDVPFMNAEHTDSEHRIRKAVPVETSVAFYAYVSSSLSNLGAYQDIVFDHVVTNIGNAYNGNHGTFVTPTAGTYVFTATLSSLGTTWGHFVVNGVIDAKFDVAHTVYSQASQTIVVDLQPGDDVSIQNSKLGGGVGGDSYSTFSGFLLYEHFGASTVIG